MPDLNQITITGRLGRNAEIYNTSTGVIAKAALAVSAGYGDRQQTIWLQLTVFGKGAEAISSGGFWTKGTRLWIAGELHEDTWQDKQTGQPRTRIGVIVRSWGFCESKQNPAAANQPQAATPATKAPAQTWQAAKLAQSQPTDYDQEELPF